MKNAKEKFNRLKKTKVIAITIALFLIPVLSIAANQKVKADTTQIEKTPRMQNTNAAAIHEPGTGIDDPDTKQKGNQPNLIATQETEDTDENGDEDDTDIGNRIQAKTQAKFSGDNEGTSAQRAIQRRSQTANAVQTMLQISEKNEGVGQKIRIIAQNQNKEMEEVENSLQSVKKRSGFLKFLIGPKYGKINGIEESLEQHSGRLEELMQLKEELPLEDAEILDLQIQAMEEIKEELQTELNLEEKGFALFGWLVKLFN